MDLDLYVLRHAIAVERGTEGFENDADRPLTPEGEQKLRQVAKSLRKSKLEFDRIFSSPYLRARRTAELFASVVAPTTAVEFRDALIGEQDPREFIAELVKLEPAPGSVLMVGHEPHLSSFVSLLISGSTQPCLRLKKAGFCKLSVTALQAGRCAELEWLLTPRQMQMMG